MLDSLPLPSSGVTNLVNPLDDSSLNTILPKSASNNPSSLLIIDNFQTNNSGFSAQFNQDLNLNVLNLYDGIDSTVDQADIIFTGQNTGAVKGSLSYDTSSKTLNFIKSGGVLAPDIYSVTFFGQADGLVSQSGLILDGDKNGVAGGNFTTQFNITANNSRVISLPDIVRGPAQLASSSAIGVPIRISDATGVSQVSFELNYDPSLLAISGVQLASGLPSDWSLKYEISGNGKLDVTLSGSSPLTQTGVKDLVMLQTSVPGTATIGANQVLKLDKLQVNNGTIEVRGDNSLQQIAYFGDTTGNGTYSGLDAAYISRTVVGLDSGFDFYQRIDPNLIADITGNNALSGLDAAYVSQKAVGIQRPEIPNLPSNRNSSPIADQAGNAIAQARTINPSINTNSYGDWVGGSDTQDYYRFTLGAASNITLKLSNLSSNVNFRLLDANGTVIQSGTNNTITSQLNAGTYGVEISSIDNGGITPLNLTTGTFYNISAISVPVSFLVDSKQTNLITNGLDQLTFLPSEVVPSPSGSNITIQTVESKSPIKLDQFRQDARFNGINGSGFATVVLDTGINLKHPFFGPDQDNNGIADRIVYQYDFADGDNDASDKNGHGSNVTSIVASQDATYTGMAPGANIIHLKVFKDDGSGNFGYTESALQWVVQNARQYKIASVNLSLGDSQNHVANQGLYGLADELAALERLGVIVVSASGNSFYGFQSKQGVAYPSADPNSLSIGAVYDSNIGNNIGYGDGGTAYTTKADQITPFSQRHATLTTIFAPGAAITGAAPTGTGTVTQHGTSQAAPHIAGIAVLAQQLANQTIGRNLTVSEFKSLLVSTGDIIKDGDDENDNATKTGLNFRRVNVLALGEAILKMANTATIGSINTNQVVNGTLANTDPSNGTRSGSFADDYLLSGITPGQQIKVSLVGNFNTFLQVIDQTTQRVVIENDDANGSTNSEVNFTAVGGVKYLLRVTSSQPQATGTYTLTTSNRVTDKSAEVGLDQSVSQELTTADKNNPTRDGALADDYNITGLGSIVGQSARIKLDAAFDGYLQLINRSTGQVIAENDDANNSSNPELDFMVESGIDYIARVTSYYKAATGKYTLSVSSDTSQNAENTIVVNQASIFSRSSSVGILSANDKSNSQTGAFYDDYTLTGITVGQKIQVSLDSNEFDAFLELINQQTQEVIASNDDSNNDGDSSITFVVENGINYAIRATSDDGGEGGSYKIKTVVIPANISALGINQVVQGSLTNTDSVGTNSNYYDDYTLSGLTPGQEIIISLESFAFDSSLELIDNSTGMAIASNDDFNGSSNSQLAFTPQSGITYTVRATSLYGQETGDYTIKAIAATFPTPANLLVDQAITNSLSEADLTNSEGKFYDSYLLTGVSVGEVVQISLKSSEFDTYLELVNNATGQIINFNDNTSDSTDAQLSFVVQSGISYLVRATSYYDQEIGSYTIKAINAANTILSLNQTINNSLTDTDLISSEDSYYDDYAISGFTAGQKVVLELDSAEFDSYLQLINRATGEIIDENDNSDDSITNSELSFIAKSGVDYIARVTSFNNEVTGNYTIKAISGTISNTISVNQSIQGELSFTDDITGDGLNYYDDYFLTGVSSNQNVTVNLTSGDFDSYLSVFDADTDAILYNNNNANGTNSQLNWTVGLGKNYRIRVSSFGTWQTGAYSLNVI